MQEILNRCFDDIERFMARLHGVADAIKELEKRRRSRKKKSPVYGGLFACFSLHVFFQFRSFDICFFDVIPDSA
jgi:hypothetical protein